MKILKKLGSSLFISFILLFFYLPIVILVVFSFNSKAFPTAWESFSLHWYRELFNNGEVWESFGNSIIVASFTTLLCQIMALSMIFFQTFGVKLDKYVPLFYGNLIIPDTVIAVALLSYFSILNIPLGLVTIIVAHSILGLGITIPILFVRYKDLDNRVLEASRALGANAFQTFYRIVLPFMKPALLATALMVFVLSFDDFILAYFCSGTSTPTLSLFLVASLRFGISPEINALAALMLILVIALVAFFFSIQKKQKGGNLL